MRSQAAESGASVALVFGKQDPQRYIQRVVVVFGMPSLVHRDVMLQLHPLELEPTDVPMSFLSRP